MGVSEGTIVFNTGETKCSGKRGDRANSDLYQHLDISFCYQAGDTMKLIKSNWF